MPHLGSPARTVLFHLRMLGKTVLVHTDDKLGLRRLSGHLRAAGNEVLVADGARAACDLLAARAVDLVFVDVAAPVPHEVVAAARAAGTAVVVLSSAGDPAVMLDFVCEQQVEHFLARDEGAADPTAPGAGAGDHFAREVVVTAEKILRGDLFGIEKYLPGFGVEITTATVRGAAERDDVVECLTDYVSWLGAGSEARRAVGAIADELITNAVYDAPRNADGSARYAAVDRRTKVTLAADEEITVRWGSDGQVLAIAVSDPFGALRADHVRAGLRRCLTQQDPIEQKAGGAGLGLYTTLAYSAQLVVNVERGVRTEVISLIDLRRGQGVRRGGRSLHVFTDDAVARDVSAGDAVPVSVEVSHSMLVELREHLAPAARRATVVPLTRRRASSPAPGAEPTPRARGSTPPPVAEAVADGLDASTACGLLHGALEPERALHAALRFLSQHYQGALAYAVDGERLDAVLHAGRPADWPMLHKLRLLGSGPASIATLGRGEAPRTFAPACPLDYRVALWTAGTSEAPGVVVPVRVAGALRWILYAAGPVAELPLADTELAQVRRELEASLLRLDADEPEIEVRWG